MKTIIISLMCMVLSIFAFGQDRQGGMIDELVTVNQPKFAGIENAVTIYTGHTESLEQYVVDNLELDDIYYKEGTEIVRFFVTSTGELSGFAVVNSVDPNLDEEVIALLKKTNGMWIPGMSNGQPVTMEAEVAIYFSSCCEEGEAAVVEDFKESATRAYVKANEKFLTEGKAEKALKHYNTGVRYLPKDDALLYMRGLCRYELGDEAGAMDDWTRAKANGVINPAKAFAQYSHLKGYNTLMELANR